MWPQVIGVPLRSEIASNGLKRISLPVPSLIESNAKPGQAATDRRTRLDIIFADAACKHDQICSIKRRDHRGELLAHGIAEHRNGQPRIGI